MKTFRTAALFLVILIILMPVTVFASDVSGAIWEGKIKITNNGDSTAENAIATANISSQALIDNRYASANLSDVAVKYGETDIPFMPSTNSTNPWAFFVDSISAGLNFNYTLYSGNVTGGDINYFPGEAGASANDSASLELIDNFTIEQKGWIDTTQVGANLTGKLNAFRTYISASGNITSLIYDWQLPTSDDDPSDWSNETNAYDDSTATSATHSTTTPNSWGQFLTLSYDATDISAIRFYSSTAPSGDINLIDVDCYYNSTWNNVFEGEWTENVWNVYNLDDTYSSTGIRVRFYNDNDGTGGRSASLEEVQFLGQLPVTTPNVSSGEYTVTTQMQSPFLGISVVETDNLTPVSDNLVFNAPLWQPECDADPFTSIDAYEHSCDVNGAVWSSSGYSFDGTDDNIIVTDAASIQNIFDGGGTLIFWINADSAGEGGYGNICFKRGAGFVGYFLRTFGEAGGKVKLSFYQDFNTTDGGWNTSSTEVTLGVATQVAVTYDNSDVANDPIVYVNGSSVALTEYLTPEGTRESDAGNNLYIGANRAGSETFDGTIGEVLGYNRVLTPAEIARNFNATKSKYTDGDIYTYSTLATVPDTSSNWTFFQNYAMPYVEYHKIWCGDTLQQHIEWQYNEGVFTDLSGNGHDVTPSFRTTSTDDITASLISFNPVSESELPTFTLSASYDVLITDATPEGNMFEDGDYSKLPADPINAMLDEAEIPRAAWWLPFIFLGICIIGFIIYGATTMSRGPSGRLAEGQIDGSLLIMFIVMEALLVALGKMGPIPLWPSYLFPIAGLALILSRKHYAWG